jgi:hypothetical protein
MKFRIRQSDILANMLTSSPYLTKGTNEQKVHVAKEPRAIEIQFK